MWIISSLVPCDGLATCPGYTLPLAHWQLGWAPAPPRPWVGLSGYRKWMDWFFPLFFILLKREEWLKCHKTILNVCYFFINKKHDLKSQHATFIYSQLSFKSSSRWSLLFYYGIFTVQQQWQTAIQHVYIKENMHWKNNSKYKYRFVIKLVTTCG